jgi:hypothetical protein
MTRRGLKTDMRRVLKKSARINFNAFNQRYLDFLNVFELEACTVKHYEFIIYGKR